MRRRAWVWVVGIAAATVVACGSDAETTGSDGHGGNAGSGGQAASGWWCTCNDTGSAAGLVSDPPEANCAAVCEGLGGVLGVEPQASAIGTAACDAFCAAADALGCPGDTCASKQDFWCTTGPGECLEALIASLECKAELGEWSCDDDSWQMTASCPTFDELCGAGGSGGH